MLLEKPWLLYEEDIVRKHLICSCCGMNIYYELDDYEQDECYQIQEDILCENCVEEYVKEKFFLKLVENENVI